MEYIYARLITKGLKTIDDVPAEYTDKVVEILRGWGYNVNDSMGGE